MGEPLSTLSGMSVYLSAVEALQLTSVVLTSFRNGTFELSLQYDQKVCVNIHVKVQYLGHLLCAPWVSLCNNNLE